jgi:hypothetical protein
MYVNEQLATWYENQRTQSRRVDAAAKKNQRQITKRAWTYLLEEDKVAYEKMARDHQARQPFIKECLVDALQKKKKGNCTRSFRSLEKATDAWLTHSTIERWLKAQPTYKTYSKKVRPGLTEQN